MTNVLSKRWKKYFRRFCKMVAGLEGITSGVKEDVLAAIMVSYAD